MPRSATGHRHRRWSLRHPGQPHQPPRSWPYDQSCTNIQPGPPSGGRPLACELSESGHSVTIIDADPNRPVARWSKRSGKPKNLAVLENVTEETIIKTIDRVRAGSEYVIVDLEGTASLMVAYAISRASLVIIPTQGSMLDAAEAVKAIRLVKRQEEAFKLSIPCAVLLTRTNAAIRPRSLNAIEAEFVENGIRVFDVRLHEREAFRAVFSFGGTLSMLD